MHMRFSLPVFVPLVLILTGCDRCNSEVPVDEIGTARMDLELIWGESAYVLEQVATDHNGYTVRLDNLQFYIAPMQFRSNGEWIEGADVSLIDFGLHAPHITSTLASGTYDAVRFGMGLPPEINTNIDPASYPNSHPLSVIGSAGMFWTWSSGYIFVKYEGKFALEAGTQLLESVSYHCGTDSSYRMVTLELPEPFIITSEETRALTLTLDAAKALNGPNDSIDLAVDPITHNAQGSDLGSRMMDLLIDAWEISAQ
ncbi:MAG: hypothetical protein CL845_05530 [Crocinitomicaceae bacterium]|nr:hypothetical protein [Crocinitomicaceae bacterium]